MSNAEWMQRDLKVLWHPCTQMKDHETLPLIPVARGEGLWLYDHDGNRYLDAISSWWTSLFGHAHPRINAAVKDQLDRLEHVMLAGFSHAPVIELSERLIALAPPGLTRCFYTDNGSSSIEVALKMSLHWWHNQGQPQKRLFVNLAGAYHGETMAALSVGDVALFKAQYQDMLMPGVLTVPSPDASQAEPGESAEAFARRQFTHLEQLLAERHAEICAVVIEPLVQCAAGMRIHHPVYLQLLRDACTRHGVHLIADEIAVGFGRTGTLFACEQAGITPDFLCLSKGISGGYLPLAVVLLGDAIYDAFYDDYASLRGFLHSHTYTGNPLACRAALATLDLFDELDTLNRNRGLSAHMAQATAHFRDHPHIGDVRQQGMILAFEMVADKAARTPYDWRERRGLAVYQQALQRGALLRPIGNVVYWMPPYIINETDIDWLAALTLDGIDAATRTSSSIVVPDSGRLHGDIA